jgi:adenylate cyclase
VRLWLLALSAVVGVGVGLATYLTDALRSIELDTVDVRFSVRGDRHAPDDIVVVGIDAKTFQDLVDQRWPFTHDQHAKVLDRLSRDGAKVIAFDIQFSEPSNTDKQSVALLDAVDRANHVVLATTEQDQFGNANVFSYYVPIRVQNRGEQNSFIKRDLGADVAESTFPTDPGGVIRRVPYKTGALKSFAVTVAEEATGRRITRDDLGGDDAWIDYYGGPRSFKYVSYSDVRLGKTRPGLFKNKIVVIGATASSLQDQHPTSTSGDAEMAGPEIHAHAIGTALAGFPLQPSPAGLDIALILLLGLAAPGLSLLLPAFRALAIAVTLALAYTVVVQLAFNSGTILPFIYPIVAAALSTLGALGAHYVTEAFERERTRDMFARFVPESVVGQVLGQAEGLRLGGVAREATVMFSDLRGFTSFAESLEPDQVITVLNRYLTAMVDDAILPNGGTLVDYMGDGIMAVFGAPIEMDDHPDRALAAARAKLEELSRFNDWLRSELGLEKSFRMGIGLNTGRVMSGNVGSEQRLAYTAIGDTTNTAARLEAMTKGTPYMLFMSEATRAGLSEEPSDLVFVDNFEVRGREQTVQVWSVGQATGDEQAGESFKSVSR